MRRLLPLVLLTGCAAIWNYRRTDAMMKSWVGRSRDDLLRAHGAPNLTAALSSGDTVYTYLTSWNRAEDGKPAEMTECRLSFTVSKNVVTAWSKARCPDLLDWK